jgi:hypothetical protein
MLNLLSYIVFEHDLLYLLLLVLVVLVIIYLVRRT